MRIGYARIAKSNEKLTPQLSALREFDCHRIFSEILSGVEHEETELDNALDLLGKGDTLIVASLDRLGRSFFHTIRLLVDLLESEINLVSVEEGINTAKGRKVSFWDAVNIFSNMEKNYMKERKRVSMWAIKKRKGEENYGRPKGMEAQTLQKMLRAREMRAAGQHTMPEIAKTLGIKTRTLYSWATKIRNLDKNNLDTTTST